MTVLTEEKIEQQSSREGSLEIVDLTKKYGNFTAVDNISLEIKEGEFLTFLGGSGSGKSTTLLAIAGFLEPTDGEILLSGNSIINRPPHKRNIGMVFQQYSLFPHMSIFDNVAFPLKMRKVNKQEIKRRVKEMLELVELEQFSSRKPSQLSGGQQQRVALARALVFEPNILLMDEPLAALDKKLRETMQLEIRRLHERLGLTIVYVTHDQEEALKLSDRIAIFNHGKIEQVGTPAELYDKPNSKFVAQFLGDSNVFESVVTTCTDTELKLRVEDSFDIVVERSQYYSVGEKVQIIVRPEKMKLSKQKSINSIQSRVKEIIYLGESNRYILEGKEDIFVKEQISVINGDQLQVGDDVFIEWDPKNSIVLPENS